MPNLSAATALFAVSSVLIGPAQAGPGSHKKVEIQGAAKHDVSPPLRTIPPKTHKPEQPKESRPLLRVRRPGATTTVVSGQKDTAVQAKAGTLVGTAPGQNFLGVGSGFVGPQGAYTVFTAPPDTNGAAGPTQYVHWVNTSFAVIDKATGNVLYGPADGNTLWSGFGGACEGDNDGDITAKYDRAAGRWVLSQLAVSGGPPYYQCVAVSTSADATGTYNRYAFQFDNINDYPKIGVWSDAYYLSFNQFDATDTFLGAEACAMDRQAMVRGLPATIQCFTLDTAYGAILPSDLDGATPPSTGEPAFFVGFEPNTLDLWRFHVDFATPGNSTLTGPFSMPVAPYTMACGDGTVCIPQPGTTQKLDSVGDRLMYRLAYRNFGDHEALVVNHSVNSGNSVGVRWYELRDPNGTPTVYQQGTYSPDNSYRWMGSMAMDKVGNMALGYSVSSKSVYPSIRYTGRTPDDPLGEMEAENSIMEGGGSQRPFLGQSLSRWGDYTSMAMDPDDCTFWYTNEYLVSSGSFNWSTRIGSFSFPSCTSAPPTPDFVLSTTPASRIVAVGNGTTFTTTVTPSGGFNGTLTFSASGLPAGATATFNPATVAGSGSTTLTITTSAASPLGTFPITIAATSGSVSHSTNVALVVYVPATAAFIRPDSATQGTWQGAYGADGYAIANGAANYPAYAAVNIGGASTYTWTSSTSDVRALQQPNTSSRIAAAWYSSSGFTVDVSLADAAAHQLALYALDWDNQGRTETVTLTDAVSGATLDTRNLSAFTGGQWLVWNITGHVTVNVTKTAGPNAVINGVFFDPPAGPDYFLGATPASQTVARGGSANYTVTVNPSAGFGGTVNLSASGLPGGATATFNPASVSGSGSATLTLGAGTAVPGTYPVTITGTSGSLSHSVNVTLVVFVPTTAVFVKTDTATQGTWKGVYGAEGYSIANLGNSFPAYATVSVSGQNNYTWASSTTDVRALQKPGAATDRIASTWYSTTSFNIDINLTDGNPHQVALYGLDWENAGRGETIAVTDATSGAVLDSRSLSGFNNGQWIAWNLTGHVILKVTRTAGNNAALSGLFFDPIAGPDFYLSATPGSQTIAAGDSTTYTMTVGSSGGFSGVVNLSASGLPSGATASFNPASVNTSGSSTLTVTTTAGTPGGGFAITITGTSGSLSHTATVMLVIPVPITAAFVKSDVSTQGTWKGVYGADGYSIANLGNGFPAYAQVSVSGQNSYTWASSTVDPRALQKPGTATDRIASTWYSGTTFNIDINLTDGNQHQVAFYSVDWENAGRAQTFTVVDAVSGSTLDTRSLAGFNGGTWMVWNLRGHVTVKVTRTGGNNAAVSGVFFDPLGGPDFYLSATPASQSVTRGSNGTYTVTVGAANGFSGPVSLSATGLPNGAAAGFNPASVNTSGSSTLTITTTPTTQGGAFTIMVTGTSGSVSHTATVTLVIPIVAAATLVKTDTTTQGTWQGAYGASGYGIANLVNSYPSFALVTLSGQSNYTWNSSTTDVRALQKPGPTGRIASTWYSGGTFNIDINLTDGNSHDVALYCLDWDNLGRAETITITDASNGNVLNTQNVSAFSGGEWLVWNVTGHVTIKVTRTAGNNAVVSGVFFNN